jgi:hypothetical protein
VRARLGCFAVLAFTLVGSQPAAAGEPSTGALARFRLGLRTGFGVPFGQYAEVRTFASFRDPDVNAISDDVHGVIPFWLDAGYRLSSQLTVGAYFVFGLVLPKVAPATNPLSGGCPEGFDCAATGLRAGIQGEYAFLTGPVRPWLGLGLGYEWVETHLQGKTLDLDLATGHSGPEFLHLQAGTDFRLTPNFALGPFLTLTAMQYTSCRLELNGQRQSCELDDRAWHGWALLGARGTLDL